MFKKNFILIFCVLLLTSCSNDHSEKLQGYIEGRFNYLASNYPGIIIKLLVQRGDVVKTGQSLAILDTELQKAAFNAANENLKQATVQYEQIKANLTLAELTLQRYIILRKNQMISQETLDTARANRDAAKAQLDAANANLLALRRNISQTKGSYNQKIITAPQEGKIFDNYYEVGDLVPANSPVFGLLAPANVYVVFFIPESLLSKIKIGNALQFTCDGCEKTFSATIRFISPNAEYTPPIIYSHDSRQKLVYRVEAAVSPATAKLLHPGQPIDIELIFKN